MEIVNIILIVVGLIIAIISFLFKEDKEENSIEKIKVSNGKSEEILSQKDLDSLKERSEEILEETDSELSRLSCKKINELSEYSDQVLEKISLNHREVIFLYDMLTEKDKEVKESLGKLEDVKHEVTKLIVELNEAIEKTPKIEKEEKKEEIKEKFVNIKRGLQAEQLIGDSYGMEKVELVNGVFREKKEVTEKKDVTDKKEVTDKKDVLIKELKNKDRVANRIRSRYIDSNSSKRVEPTIINSSSETKTPKYIEIKQHNEKTNLDDIKDFLDEIETSQTFDEIETSQTFDKKDNEIGNVRAKRQEEMNNNNDQILKLHSQGLNYVEISKKLDLGVGEVMLVINLYKNKAKI